MDAGLLNISQSSSPANAGDDVTELSDDSAALSHRLEHLESQLVVLQKRNAELERMNKTAVAEVPVATVPTAQDLAGRWWPFMLGLVLLSGEAVSSWLKYRKNRLADRETKISSATTQLAPEDEKVAPVPVKQTEEIEILKVYPVVLASIRLVAVLRLMKTFWIRQKCLWLTDAPISLFKFCRII